jgi:hypothetical protein
MTNAQWLAEHARISDRRAHYAQMIADSVCLEPSMPPEDRWVREYRRLDAELTTLCTLGRLTG